MAPSGQRITQIPIEAGQVIWVPGVALDRLKCVWGEDADFWRPERWLEEHSLPGAADAHVGWAHTFSFSAGPRSCIGMRLGSSLLLLSPSS